jgi:hypothetical protein
MENRMAKSFWQIILFIAIIILALNAFTLWQVIGSKTLADIANGQYRPFGIPSNPLPDIFRTSLAILVFLALLIWATLRVWNKVILRHRAMKRIAAFITSITIAGVASIASYFIDGTWASAFHNSPAFGFPISPFVFTNSILVFGSVALLATYMMNRAVRNNQQQL